MLMSDDISLKIAILLEGAAIDYMFRDPPSGTRQTFRASIDFITEKAKRKLREELLNAYYDLYAVLYEPTLTSFSSSSV